MWMVAANYRRTHRASRLAWSCLRVGGQPALSLHSSNELGELSHDDSTINIVVVIIRPLLLCRSGNLERHLAWKNSGQLFRTVPTCNNCRKIPVQPADSGSQRKRPLKRCECVTITDAITDDARTAGSI